MSKPLPLERAIIKSVATYKALPDIERDPAVAKLLKLEAGPYVLGITLAKLCVDGRIHYWAPHLMRRQWPLYSAEKRRPKPSQFPKREDAPPDEERGD